VRLALDEKRFFRSDGRDYWPPDRSILQSAAVVRTDIDGTVPASAWPLRSGDVGPWWHEVGALKASLESSRPQLIQLALVSDWLGRNLALVPPLVLRYRAQLGSPGYGAPLRWYDFAGHEAVVLRTWRVRGDRIDTEWYSMVGADLLMRPDLLEILLQVCGWPLKELHRVRVENLNRSSP
jgi:hypothetical protein